MRNVATFFFALLALYGVEFTSGVAAPPTVVDQQLQNGIATLAKEHDGEVGIKIKNLQSGEFYEYNGDQVMPTASLIKLPLMFAAYREVDAGRLDLDSKVALQAAEKVPGSGVLTEHFSDGVELPLRDYMRLMIRYSDNTATNVIAGQIGVRKTAEVASSLGCENTKLHSKLYRGDTTVFPERSKEFGIGSTTANEMVRLLELLQAGSVAKKESCEEMFGHLKSCADRSMLARHLPKNVVIAQKTGGIANCRTNAGIIFTEGGPIAVCVLTSKNEDQSWGSDNAAELLIAEIGKVVVNRFGAAEASSDLQEGSFGKLVESLQRTLNDRLKPTPNLSIDGDFGPGTKRQVVRFQESMGLKADGIVNDKTWKALGKLIETDAPVPPPSVVNREQLKKLPLPALDGPPIVTCASWVVGDPKTGEVVFQSESDPAREAASTTKIMTAFVVLEYIKEHPAFLDEVVTFSKRADDTVGSTSAVRAGEMLPVSELLYGLMLPSGNDASVALAEQVGAKLLPDEDAKGDETLVAERAYAAFLKRMNQTAQRLGMKSTVYKNTHGLPNEKHVTTSADLFRLACEAMQDPMFAKIVQTRQHGCTLKSVKGYERNIVWRSTNQLLKLEGYFGVKTGTTNAAGACLVSCGERNGDRLITVVLGSSSTPARYADTRNLFRWAWKKRAE